MTKATQLRSHCEIKRSRREDKLEVMVGKRTKLEKSRKVFEVQKQAVGEGTLQLKDMENVSDFSRMNVKVKVLRVERPMEIGGGGKKKQDVVIADASANSRLTVWEEEIGQLEKGKSYSLTGMLVREFNGKKYLTTAKQNSLIEVEGEDVGDVQEEKNAEEGSSGEVDNVKVIGVERVDSYDGCLKCGGRVVKVEEDEEYGECTKCEMLQCREECKKVVSAQLTVKTPGGMKLALCAFDKVLINLAEKPAAEITKMSLMKAKAFAVTLQLL